MPVLSTTLNTNVFQAIQAMDSYNRGYGANVNNLSGNSIGAATIFTFPQSVSAGWQAAGFFASAYNWNGVFSKLAP
jgi:hypothetical protein